MPHLYHFDIKINERNRSNAGTKATEDCRNILQEIGFKDLELYFVKNPLLLPYNLARLLSALLYYSVIIKPGSFIIVQYPLKGINKFFGYFIKLLRKKKCKVACIIHDIDSLRSNDSKAGIQKEMQKLSAYDGVISHNAGMTAWLRLNGYKGIIQEILLFDYLLNNKCGNTDTAIKTRNSEIVFAGNLGRGNFLPALVAANTSIHLNLYGIGLDNSLLKKNLNIVWKGSYTANEIAGKLQGSFGLVWDGDSIDDINGLMGNYMRYNTPHKTSLYLAAGLPVIVSAHAAIALFVKENSIGIVIKSLADIEKKIENITQSGYEELAGNACKMKEKLVNGFFLKKAVSSLQQLLYTK